MATSILFLTFSPYQNSCKYFHGYWKRCDLSKQNLCFRGGRGWQFLHSCAFLDRYSFYQSKLWSSEYAVTSRKLSGRDTQDEYIQCERKVSLKTYQCQIISTAVQGSNHHLLINYPNWTQRDNKCR